MKERSRAIGKAEVALQAFAKQNANADVQDPLTGFFVDIILTTDAVFNKMFAVGSCNGGSITGTQCLTLIRKAVFVTQQAALHASDPVKGTGDKPPMEQ
ncbi:hypothetical protein RvY_07249 [Ramazzottius varieornatus]|uniref:Uncharacterized protein n=1 Tax=Ramazzottius varieornatus TaxID=947166 RepID=A0A1D1V1E9_RAMVA|nr:hypothetical protein RvY_07249 [Ramazzottius varieornatus]